MGKRNYKTFEFEDCVGQYLKEVSNIKKLSRDEEKSLLKKISEGNESALHKLLKSNIPFVIKLAKAYRGKGLSFSDLISEGNVGLAWAARKFDFSKDTKFICYAQYWIRAKITDALDRQNKNAGNYEEYQLVDISTANLDEDENLINATYEDDLYDTSSRKTCVNNLLSTLEEQEQEVLKHTFGLNNYKELNQKEICQKLNLSPEKVRKITEQALKKLKISCMGKNLEEFEELKCIS